MVMPCRLRREQRMCGLRGQPATRWDDRFKAACVKIIGASVAMGAALYIAVPHTSSFFLEDATLMQQIVGLVILIGGGASVYGAVIVATGAIKIGDLKKVLRKGS